LATNKETLRTICLQANKRWVEDRGNFKSNIAAILEYPSEKEISSGVVGVDNGAGDEFDRICKDSGISTSKDIWITGIYKTDKDFIESLPNGPELCIGALLEDLYERKPKIIIVCCDPKSTKSLTGLNILLPQCKSLPYANPSKAQKEKNPFQIFKWRGSLLVSAALSWPHYIIPMCHPNYILRDWSERQVSVLIAHRAKKELDFWKTNGKLQPLPQRDIRVQSPDLVLIAKLEQWLANGTRLSSDIETLRNRETKKNFVYTIALAPSPFYAESFCLWDIAKENRVKIWRLLSEIHKSNPIIGQNFRIFDLHWLAGTAGLDVNPFHVDDTLERHHVLYPEMEHSLQFQTLQYTREPYYKDEGKTFSAKNKVNLLRYGGKDACVTYEIFEEQEKEFIELAA